MRTLKPCHAGDIGDTRVLTIGGIDNLDDVDTVEAHVSRSGESTATLDAAVTDSAANEVTVQLGTAVNDWLPAGPTLGAWEFQLEFVFLDGSELTWPTQDASTGAAIDSMLLPVMGEFG